MNQVYKKILISLASLILTISFLFLGLAILNTNQLIYGLKVANIEIGNKTQNQAKALLADRLKSFDQKNITLFLAEENKFITTNPSKLGLVVNPEKTIESAYQLGRNKNIFLNLWQQTKALLGQYNLGLAVDLNQTQFENFCLDNFIDFEEKAQDSVLSYEPAEDLFKISQSKLGLIADRTQLKKDLINKIKFLDFSKIRISLIEDRPQVTEVAAEITKNQIELILSTAPFNLKYKAKGWLIDKNLLIDWLIFQAKPSGDLEIAFNQDLVESFLVSLAPEINQSAQNAQLKKVADEIIIVLAAEDEVFLDSKATYQLIQEKIAQFKPTNSKEILIQTQSNPAQVRAETLKELGLTHYLGQGESNFSGSSFSRKKNIEIGLSKINSTLVAPQEEFSFNQTLGQVTAADGYLPEMVIKDRKLVPEYGGGLCQVSTTLFRAAIYSGLEITERYPHAFPVSYYNPQGFDASIYPPHPDLRFINDTPNYILIQGYASGTKAFFDIFGTDDHRQIKVEGPYIYESNPDGSMKAVLTQSIFKEEELLRQKKFWSNYKSPALFPVEKNPLE